MWKPNKVTVIFRNDTEENFLSNNIILDDGEICVIERKNGKQYTVVGDGKSAVNKCKRIKNFPYTSIVAKKDMGLNKYKIYAK